MLFVTMTPEQSDEIIVIQKQTRMGRRLIATAAREIVQS